MSIETENTTNLSTSCNETVKRGRPKKTLEELLESQEKKREKALARYQQKKEECIEKSKLHQQRYRELYKYIKALVKEDKLNSLTDEQKQHIKEIIMS